MSPTLQTKSSLPSIALAIATIGWGATKLPAQEIGPTLSGSNTPLVANDLRTQLNAELRNSALDYDWARYAALRASQNWEVRNLTALAAMNEARITRGALTSDQLREVRNQAFENFDEERKLWNPKTPRPLEYLAAAPVVGEIVAIPIMAAEDLAEFRENPTNIKRGNELAMSETYVISRSLQDLRVTQRLSVRDPVYKEVAEELLQGQPGLGKPPISPRGLMGANMAELKAKDPEFARSMDLLDSRLDRKRLIEDTTKAVMKANSDQADALKKEITALEEKLKNRKDSSTTSQAELNQLADLKVKLQQQEEKDFKTFQDNVALARGAIRIGLMFRDKLAPEDQKLLIRGAAVATCAISVYENIGLKNFKKISSLVCTANIVGAAFELFSAFNGGGGNDQAILEQLGQISQQIDTLRNEMKSEFEYTNAKIDGLFNVVTAGFKTVIQGITNLDYDLKQVSEQLREVTADLETLHYTQDLYFRTLLLAEAEDKVLQVLRAHEQFVTPQLTQQDFDAVARYFIAKGTGGLPHSEAFSGEVRLGQGKHALFDVARSELAQRGAFTANFQSLVADTSGGLGSHSFVPIENINYLRKLFENEFVADLSTEAGRRAYPTVTALIADGRMPNVGLWAFGIDALTESIEKWPVYSKNLTPADIKAFQAVGEEIKTTLELYRKPELISELMAKYQNDAAAFSGEIDQFAKEYIAAFKIADFDLYKDKIPQKVTGDFAFPAKANFMNGESGVEVDLPGNAKAMVPEEVANAVKLGYGSLTVYVRADWANFVRGTPGTRSPGGRNRAEDFGNNEPARHSTAKFKNVGRIAFIPKGEKRMIRIVESVYVDKNTSTFSDKPYTFQPTEGDAVFLSKPFWNEVKLVLFKKDTPGIVNRVDEDGLKEFRKARDKVMPNFRSDFLDALGQAMAGKNLQDQKLPASLQERAEKIRNRALRLDGLGAAIREAVLIGYPEAAVNDKLVEILGNPETGIPDIGDLMGMVGRYQKLSGAAQTLPAPFNYFVAQRLRGGFGYTDGRILPLSPDFTGPVSAFPNQRSIARLEARMAENPRWELELDEEIREGQKQRNLPFGFPKQPQKIGTNYVVVASPDVDPREGLPMELARLRNQSKISLSYFEVQRLIDRLLAVDNIRTSATRGPASMRPSQAEAPASQPSVP